MSNVTPGSYRTFMIEDLIADLVIPTENTSTRRSWLKKVRNAISYLSERADIEFLFSLTQSHSGQIVAFKVQRLKRKIVPR